MAIRDAQGGKVGSASQFIEVPDLKKNRLTTSSVVIENFTADEWKMDASSPAGRSVSKPMSDTAVRKIKPNTVLRYGYEIYNAKTGSDKRPRLLTKIRVFRNGELILDGRQSPPDIQGQTDLQHLKATGALAIGQKMTPGDYILQVVVTDTLAKPKQNTATQIVQFEVSN